LKVAFKIHCTYFPNESAWAVIFPDKVLSDVVSFFPLLLMYFFLMPSCFRF